MKFSEKRKEIKAEKEKINKRVLGAKYEEIASGYLIKQGFDILDRNWRKKNGEIDIIARDGEYLVFCEVKYRSSDEAGGADYSISAEKQRQIAKIARIYMAEKHISFETFCRFDCVLIDGKDIKHIKNAWQV